MSTASQLSYNPTLTNYAIGVSTAIKDKCVAAWIAPWFVTGATHGKYKKWDSKNSTIVVDTVRPIGGDAKQLGFSASDLNFDCMPHALDGGIDEWEVKGLDAGMVSKMRQRRIASILAVSYRSHDKFVIDTALANVAATANLGQWSDAAVDPVSEIDSQIVAINTATGGLMPNRGVISLAVWQKIKNHPKILQRLKGIKASSLTLEDFSAMLVQPVEFKLSTLNYDTAKPGATENQTAILGSEVLIWYSEPMLNEEDFSAMKTFSPTDSGIDQVRTGQGLRREIIAVDWGCDVKVTCSASMRRITVTI
jgi:hypothetical protein